MQPGRCPHCKATGQVKPSSPTPEVGDFLLGAELGRRGNFVKVRKARSPTGELAVVRTADRYVYDDADGASQDLSPVLAPMLPALQRLPAIAPHPSLAPWISFLVTAKGDFVLARPYYTQRLDQRFPPAPALDGEQRGPASPELLAHLGGLAAGIDHLIREEPAIELALVPQNVFVAGGRALLADYGTIKLTDTVDADYSGARPSSLNVCHLLAHVLSGDGPLGWSDRIERDLGAAQAPLGLAALYLHLRKGHPPFLTGDEARTLSPFEIMTNVPRMAQAYRDRGTFHVDGLSQHERRVLERAFSRDPGRRFRSCADLIGALAAPPAVEVTTWTRKAAPSPPPRPEPRWSRALDVGTPRRLSAAETGQGATSGDDGLVVVGGSTATVAYDAHGARRWRIGRPFTGLRALPDGRTVLGAEDGVRVVDPSGARICGWPSVGSRAPRPFPGDRWIDVEAERFLTCRAADGAEAWRVDLECRVLSDAAIVGRDIVVSDSTGLRLYDENGTLRFRTAIAKPWGTLAAGSPVLATGDGLLARFRFGLRGSGWYRWRPRQGDAEILAVGTTSTGPECVSEDLFVVPSLGGTDDGLDVVGAFTASNDEIWRIPLHKAAAVEGIPGGVAIVSSPTSWRFHRYRQVMPKEGNCRVTVLDRRGTIQKEIVVGEPLLPMAAHAGDHLYVVLDSGALWAIHCPGNPGRVPGSSRDGLGPAEPPAPHAKDTKGQRDPIDEGWERLDPVPCLPCSSLGRCSLCHGSGRFAPTRSHPGPADPPGPCPHCSGSGVCMTCDGEGKWRPSRKRVAPLTTPSRGREICWACKGTLYCSSCEGGRIQRDGTKCWGCDYGYCLECSGSGELEAEQPSSAAAPSQPAAAPAARPAPASVAAPLPITGYQLETCLGKRGYYIETWKARTAAGAPCVVRTAPSKVFDDYCAPRDLRPNLEAIRPALQQLVTIPPHPSIASWNSFVVTASGHHVLDRPYYAERLETRFPPGLTPDTRGPAGPALLAHLAGLAAGIDLLLRVAPATDLRIVPENLFVDGDRAVLADWGAGKLTKAVESAYDGPRLVVFAPYDLLSSLLAGPAAGGARDRGLAGPPASVFLAAAYFHLRTGRLPFMTATEARTFSPVQALAELSRHAETYRDRGTFDVTDLASPHERHVIERALSHDGRRWFSSCTALIEALRPPAPAVVSSGASTPPPRAHPPWTAPPLQAFPGDTATMPEIIRFSSAADPTAHFRQLWGTSYQSNVSALWSRSVQSFRDKVAAGAPPAELLLCLAHDIALGPHGLGVPPPDTAPFWRWLLNGARRHTPRATPSDA
jgi:hypothetical protein